MNQKIWTVYCHQNKLNGKKYFGITSKPVEVRWRDGKAYGAYLGKAINKYGWDNFEHFVLYNGLTEELAKYFEQYLISEFCTQDSNLGYNLTGGGDGKVNWHPSEATRKKISDSHKGKKASAETRAKLSKAHKGKKPGTAGKSLSEATKKKLSDSLKGRTFSEEHKKKIAEANHRRKLSDETRAKIAASLRGKTFDEARKERLRAALNRPETRARMSASAKNRTYHQESHDVAV